MNSTINYRAEIDGLRAIAVISVILFHAGIEEIPGGFIGVDIFFVISGYLITSIITKEINAEQFSFTKFYERRIRRLLPPLIPVLLLSWVAATLLLNPKGFEDFSKSLYAAIAFFANWNFLSTVDYFDTPGETTPLLHLWSLSIEEQFYFIFPVALIAIIKLWKKPATIIATLGIASFAYAIYLTSQGQYENAFYNSFGRFWELLAGAFLAFTPPLSRKRYVADLLELLGLILITGSILAYDSSTPFPGVAALPPVLGTALIILAQGRGRIISPILKSKPFIGVGLISYALYLWHWPIFVFLRIAKPHENEPLMLLGIVATAALATTSYFLLEKPAREKKLLSSIKKSYRLAGAFCIGMALMTAIGTTQPFSNFQQSVAETIQEKLYDERAEILARFDNEENVYKKTLNLNFNGKSGNYDHDKHKDWTCSYDEDNTKERLTKCLTMQAKERNILVMGDSIGRDTWHALRRAYPDTNFIMLHQSACPPGEHRSAENKTDCFRQQREILSELSKEAKINGVIINFRYRPTDWKSVLPGIYAAKEISRTVIIFGVSPMFSTKIPKYIKSLPKDSSIPRSISEDDIKLTQWSYDKISSEAIALTHKQKTTFIDVGEFFCPQNQCRLWANEEGHTPLFWDAQHLTNPGIDAFADFLKNHTMLAETLQSALDT